MTFLFCSTILDIVKNVRKGIGEVHVLLVGIALVVDMLVDFDLKFLG